MPIRITVPNWCTMRNDLLPAEDNANPTVWLAVFVIPPPSHPLTIHGSRLIGYDV